MSALMDLTVSTSNDRFSGPSQASYLSVCGKELAAHYRGGESLSFQEGVLQ